MTVSHEGAMFIERGIVAPPAKQLHCVVLQRYKNRLFCLNTYSMADIFDSLLNLEEE